MKVRLATAKDQEKVTKLLLEIFKQMDLIQMRTMTENEKLTLLANAFDLSKLLQIAEIKVAEIDSSIVGMSYAYAAEVESQTQALILDGTNGIDLHPSQEAWPGEWYLEILSVDQQYRGHGIGKQLINATLESAKDKGFKNVSLNVDYENKRAKALYERQGFITSKSIIIGEHQYYHMVKPVNLDKLG